MFFFSSVNRRISHVVSPASVSFLTFFNQGLSWLWVRGKLQQPSEKNRKKVRKNQKKRSEKSPILFGGRVGEICEGFSHQETATGS